MVYAARVFLHCICAITKINTILTNSYKNCLTLCLVQLLFGTGTSERKTPAKSNIGLKNKSTNAAMAARKIFERAGS